MVITRADWRTNGDLLAWIATEYPGLCPQEFEVAYGMLADPDMTDDQAEAVCELLRGCVAARQQADSGARMPDNGPRGEGASAFY